VFPVLPDVHLTAARRGAVLLPQLGPGQ